MLSTCAQTIQVDTNFNIVQECSTSCLPVPRQYKLTVYYLVLYCIVVLVPTFAQTLQNPIDTKLHGCRQELEKTTFITTRTVAAAKAKKTKTLSTCVCRALLCCVQASRTRTQDWDDYVANANAKKTKTLSSCIIYMLCIVVLRAGIKESDTGLG